MKSENVHFFIKKLANFYDAPTLRLKLSRAYLGKINIPMKMIQPLGVTAVLLGMATLVSGQVLFSDNFDSGAGDAANWNVNIDSTHSDATFGFNYGTLAGIPSAPHSIGGTTIGVQLRADFATVGAIGGVSISPIGQNFGTSYVLSFDFWSNMNGNANGTGSGTTQITGAGVGTSGTVAQTTATTTPSSVYFGQTGDGGNSSASKDYRVYSSIAGGGAGTGYATNSGVYAAGISTTAADNANAQYITLGGNTVPAAQTALAATQLGTTGAGAPAFAWHTAVIDKEGNTITYSIDGVMIATVDATSLTLSGGNIELFQADVNGSVSTDVTAPTWEFGLFDNVLVVAPEPATWALGLLGGAGLFCFRRRRAK